MSKKGKSEVSYTLSMSYDKISRKINRKAQAKRHANRKTHYIF